MGRVDYDSISRNYDDRYRANPLAGVGKAIVEAAKSRRRILEIGCGTGHWLGELHEGFVVGADLSFGMLRHARKWPAQLVQAKANDLPFRPGSFDMVYCVNAIHHFDDGIAFIFDAFRLLAPGGTLAIVGMDPRTLYGKWYVYDYFEGSYAADLRRFRSFGELIDGMIAAGFESIALREVERTNATRRGPELLSDPFLPKHSCSQLALLSDDAYEAGLREIEEAAQENALFKVELSLSMITGIRPPSSDQSR